MLLSVDDLSLSSSVIKRNKLSDKQEDLLNASEESSLGNHRIQLLNSTEIVVNEKGERCTVLKHQVDDDMLQNLDEEKSIGSQLLSRLQYPITKESVSVGSRSSLSLSIYRTWQFTRMPFTVFPCSCFSTM